MLEYSIIDHGQEHAQYFQGSSGIVGVGDTYNEALEDALELAVSSGAIASDDADEIESAERIPDDRDARTSCYAEDDRWASSEYPDYWTVSFVAFCGMTTLDERFDTEEEARECVAEELRRLRAAGKTVTALGDNRWESTDPDSAMMVSDDAGVLEMELVDRSDERDEALEYSERRYYVSLHIESNDE